MIIKQASDLHFTYVENTPELREAFIAKCNEFDIRVFGFGGENYLEVYSDGYDEFEICWTDDLEPQSKKLTMSDLTGIPTETPEEKAVLDGIDSAGEVEWKSGDIAILYGDQVLVIAYHPNHPVVVVETNDNEYLNVGINDLSKPETPQQREDRERLENGKAIYDLMCSIELNHDITGTPNTWGELRDEWQSVYIKLAEEVGYRKEKHHGTN